MTRLVITGLGVISAIGNDVPAFERGLFEGRQGIAPITLFDAAGFTAKVAAEVKGYQPEAHFDHSRLGLLDRYCQFGLVAAREAVRDAGIDFAAPGLRAGVFHGTGIGGQTTQDASHFRLYGERKSRLSPTTVLRIIPSSAVSQLSIEFGIRGPAMTSAAACSASGHAIATAVLMLRAGLIDVALAGGSEALLVPGAVRAWEALRVLAPDSCRPFATDRAGTVLGEGGAMLVIETLAHARARGAVIRAELAGVGLASDAFHPVQPDRAGMASAIREALRDSGLVFGDIDYINAHGTGTPQNDLQESLAIHDVFGGHARRLAVSSTKSMHGHTLGAGSALELVASVLSLQAQRVPPTINVSEPDPLCDLDCVANESRPMPVRALLSHSFAFGGMNVVMALKRWE